MKGMKTSIRWQSAVLGIGVGMVAVVCGCAAGSALMAKGVADMTTGGLWAAGITVGSGLLGSLAAMLGGGGVMDAALAAAGELVVLFALNSLLCGGQVEGAGVTVLALAGGCGAAMLLRMGQGSGPKKRRRRRKS